MPLDLRRLVTGRTGTAVTRSPRRGAGRRAESAAADSGRQQATQLVRSHRLWEAYLVEHLHLPPDHVHEPTTRMEHFIGESLQKRLTTEVAETATDPHGREIPGLQ